MLNLVDKLMHWYGKSLEAACAMPLGMAFLLWRQRRYCEGDTSSSTLADEATFAQYGHLLTGGTHE